MGRVVGSLRFDVKGWGAYPIWTHSDRQKKGGGGMQKLDIFYGCHQCMVPNGGISFIIWSKSDTMESTCFIVIPWHQYFPSELSQMLCTKYIPLIGYFLVFKIDFAKSHSYTYWLKWKMTFIAMLSGRTQLNYSSWFKMENLKCYWFFSIFSEPSHSFHCLEKLYVVFLHFFFFLYLRLSLLLELDKKNLLLEKVELTIYFPDIFTPSALIAFYLRY